MPCKTGIGQDSHRFLSNETSKPCVIGGLVFDEVPGFHANSDGDVVFHAICNAITSLTGVLILGGIADELCLNAGITDSELYLKEALKSLSTLKINHVAISIECKKPKISPRRGEMQKRIAEVLNIEEAQVGITATTGEGLTDVGCGDGVACIAILSVS